MTLASKNQMFLGIGCILAAIGLSGTILVAEEQATSGNCPNNCQLRVELRGKVPFLSNMPIVKHLFVNMDEPAKPCDEAKSPGLEQSLDRVGVDFNLLPEHVFAFFPNGECGTFSPADLGASKTPVEWSAIAVQSPEACELYSAIAACAAQSCSQKCAAKCASCNEGKCCTDSEACKSCSKVAVATANAEACKSSKCEASACEVAAAKCAEACEAVAAKCAKGVCGATDAKCADAVCDIVNACQACPGGVCLKVISSNGECSELRCSELNVSQKANACGDRCQHAVAHSGREGHDACERIAEMQAEISALYSALEAHEALADAKEKMFQGLLETATENTRLKAELQARETLAEAKEGMFEGLLEAVTETTRLKAELQGREALADAKEEMLQGLLEAATENTRLKAELQGRDELSKINDRLLAGLAENAQLKAKLELAEERHSMAQVAVENERLKVRIAELESNGTAAKVSRTAKRDRAAKKASVK